MTYEDARNWLEKNIDPTRFKTREDLMRELEKLDGFAQAGSTFDKKVVDPFVSKQKYVFNSQRDLKEFEKKQQDSIKAIEKAESQEDILKSLKQQQAELEKKIKSFESQSAPKPRAPARPKPQQVAEPEPILERTVKAVGGFFKRIFGRK